MGQTIHLWRAAYLSNFKKYSFGFDSRSIIPPQLGFISETLIIFPLCRQRGFTTRDLQKTFPV